MTPFAKAQHEGQAARTCEKPSGNGSLQGRRAEHGAQDEAAREKEHVGEGDVLQAAIVGRL